MMLIKWCAALAAALQVTVAWPQAAPSVEHGARPAGRAQTVNRSPSAAESPEIRFRSPFADYRRFSPDEPLKSWRSANEEVREAGGQVGVLKGGDGRPAGHAGHGVRGQESTEAVK